MRIALCLCGIATGLNDFGKTVEHFSAFTAYEEFFLKRYNIDVFIHSWSENIKDTLIENYHPKLYEFEPPRIFGKDQYWESGKIRLTVPQNAEGSTKSRFYSTSRSLKLKQDYERLHNFTYDIVFLSRFDCVFFNDFEFNNIDIARYPFWLSAGFGSGDCFLDLWFFGTSKMMDYYGTLYKNIDDLHKDSGLAENVWCPHTLIPIWMYKTGLKLDDFGFIKCMGEDYELARSLPKGWKLK